MKTCVLRLMLLLRQRLIERGLGNWSLSSYDPRHSGSLQTAIILTVEVIPVSFEKGMPPALCYSAGDKN